MNWDKSSKAMEASIACEVVKDVNESGAGVRVGVLVGDDDASTIKTVRQEVDVSIEKWSDISHVKRSLGNQLYGAKCRHKELSDMVIKHVQRCFVYCLAQNRDKPASLADGLHNIPRHIFGEHDGCGDWCGFRKNPETYVHKGLPRGKPLSSPMLRTDLTKIFGVYADNAQKLAPMGSSQHNESFHNTIASKAPKSRHYGSSESNDLRVASAVCQQNIGHTYIVDVLETATLSPSTHAATHGERLEAQKRRASLRKSEPAFKRRRLELHAGRSKQQVAHEVREGTTYASGCSMLPGGEELASIEIPPPVQEPAYCPIAQSLLEECTVIIADVETTDASYSAEITQLSARKLDDSEGAGFSKYILPTRPVSKQAAEVTGLTVGRASGQDVLLHHGKVVPSCTLTSAMSDLLDWAGRTGPYCLVFHNARALDCRTFMHAIEVVGRSEDLQVSCIGFVDSLPLLKAHIPGLSSYSVSSIFTHITKDVFQAHDAEADVAALRTILRDSKATAPDILQPYSMTLESTAARCTYLRERNERLSTLKPPLVTSKVISLQTASKIAGSGLTYTDLEIVHRRSGQEGLAALLQESVNGKPRVTRTARIHQAIFKYFDGRSAAP